jgi:2-oxoglutarate dehydrogenase E2 component (dihydrolipoamide succinyltransferase)
MSNKVNVTLPKLGESIHSATVVQWFKKVGDSVALDEPLLEVSTDKVNSEIPSPIAGVVIEILAQPDQELQVGASLAVISTSAAPMAEVAVEKKVEAAATGSNMQDFFSPALLRMAHEQGVSFDELKKIPATGAGGRLSKRDLEVYIEKRTPCPLKADVERVKMSGMRKAIADNMVRSFYQAPHATLITEVDVTRIMEQIAHEKESFVAKHGAKLTITCFAARAIAAALKEYPLINSSLDQDTIVVKKFVNLGLAVSVPDGLMVPVIKNCQELDLPALARAVADLSSRARTGALTPDDVKEGTITLTNFGITGIQIGIPIIRFPEVAIIGLGAATKKVVPLDDGSFVARTMVNISLTFDHRVLDGIYGCGFLSALKKHLE